MASSIRTILFVTLVLTLNGSTRAQVAVNDPANLVQNTVSALQSIKQTAQLVQQYRTLLDQYANQVREIVAIPVEVWDLVTDTEAEVERTVRMFADHRALARTLRDYQQKFVDPNFYRSSACYNRNSPLDGCTQFAAEVEEFYRLETDRQATVDRILNEELEQQQRDLERGRQQMGMINSRAKTPRSLKEALQYSSQYMAGVLRAQQSVQALLIAQNEATLRKERLERVRAQLAEAAKQSFYRHDAHFERTGQSDRW